MTAFEPQILLPGDPPRFPDPRRADQDGLVAIGGDLAIPRLLAAYRAGIFPWHDELTVPLWWSPDPRGVLVPAELHVPSRLARKHHGFRLTWNKAFPAVIRGCAANRDDGTWLVPEMIAAYTALHFLGHAHSLEVWQHDQLVGGLYGVQVGALFAAESMFRRTTDASKIALIAAIRSLASAGIELIDVQFVTAHLAQFGARQWPRERYLDAVGTLGGRRVELSGLVPAVAVR